MKFACKHYLVGFTLLYAFLTGYAIYRILLGSDSYRNMGDQAGILPSLRHGGWLEEITKSKEQRVYSEIDLESTKKAVSFHHVEIWGKAAISIYLWKHILTGELQKLQSGLISEGNVSIEELTFTFRTGPGIIQTTVPNTVRNLVLVLNGRSDDKVKSAKSWLDYLPLYPVLSTVIVVLLGSEVCENEWLLPYMHSRGGLVNAVFLVYDSTLVDDIEFYQWPLGVATYRGFPNIAPDHLDLTSPRSHICNFLGTIYKNSSRQLLTEVIESADIQDKCVILKRQRWLPQETKDTLDPYILALSKSDLTLSPVGMNTECYRIYEAMSLGSVPMIEDIVTPGHCDTTPSTSPLRLLKIHAAPAMYIRNWKDLPSILQRESRLSLNEKVERRIAVVNWYKNFKENIKKQFVNVIREKISSK